MAVMKAFQKAIGHTATQIVLTVLLFLSLSILSDRFLRGIQFDLTEDQLYTLSDGTKEILANLDEPVQLEFYFSRTLATPYGQLLQYGKRIEDTLKAIAAASRGNVDLKIIDPEPFSEAEDDAVAAGLKGIPLSDGSMLYMGLKLTNLVDGSEVLPFFSDQREMFLEYDIVKLIASLDHSERKKLALLTTLPMKYGPGGPDAMMAGRGQPYVLYEQLSEAFDLVDMDANFSVIPEGTDVLMLVQPPVLSDDQLFAIDQYVLKGGRALIFLDPHSEAGNPRSNAPNPSSLGPLLKSWGVKMPKDKVVGDASLAQRVQMGGYGPDSVKDYVFWLGITKDFLATDDVTLGSVDTLNLATSGAIEPLEGAETTVTPLVKTSVAAMLYDVSRAVGVPDPDSLLKDMKPTGTSYILSARISGPAKTAYPDKVKAASSHGGDAAVDKGNIHLVLTADTDLFDDRFWVQLQELLGQKIVVPLAGNGTYVLNLADHISGSEALLKLRGRGISKRPFTVVDEIRRNAETKYLAEEEALQKKLNDAEMRIAELEAQKPEGTTILSSEQEEEIDTFRQGLLETRKELREVKRSLRSDIVGLGKWLAFINIALVPLCIVLLVLVRLYMRRRKA